MDARIPDYWMVDGERRTVAIARPGEADRLVYDELTWNPSGASEPLTIPLDAIFP